MVSLGVYSGARGGGYGSIIGRNAFQRPRKDALAMLEQLIGVYAEQAASEAAMRSAATGSRAA